MKKLSIIMVLALLLTTFSGMFVMPATAADSTGDDGSNYAPATTPTDYRNITAAEAQSIITTLGASNAAIAIGSLTDPFGYFNVADGTKLYIAGSFPNVGTAVQTVGSGVHLCFTMIRDYTSSGYSAGSNFINIGRNGTTLTIDGGGYTISVESAVRAIHIGQNTAGLTPDTYVFKNITIDGGSYKNPMQIDSGNIFLEDGAIVKSAKDQAVVVGISGSLYVQNGAKVVATGAGITAIHINHANSVVEVNGGTVYSAAGQTIYFSSAGTCIMNSGIVANAYATQDTKYGAVYFNSKGTFTLNGGTVYATARAVNNNAAASGTGFTFNMTGGSIVGATYNIENGTTTATAPNGLLYPYGGTINISGGTINAKRPIQVEVNGRTASKTTYINISGSANLVTNVSSGYVVDVKASSPTVINISGGTIKNESGGSYGPIMIEGSGNSVSVSGSASITSTATAAIYCLVGGNTVNISGGTITAKTAIQVDAGGVDIDVSGGTFSCTSQVMFLKGGVLEVKDDPATDADETVAAVHQTVDITGGIFNTKIGLLIRSKNCTVNISGTADFNCSSWGIIANKDGVYAENLLINIYGGTFDATGTNPVFQIQDEVTAKMNIYGGTFTTTNASGRFLLTAAASYTKTFNIYGGTFNGSNTNAHTTELTNTSTTSTPSYSNRIAGNFHLAAGTLNVYGGEFIMGNGSAATGTHLYDWAGGTINLWGGNFVGGANALTVVDPASNGTGDLGYGTLVSTTACGKYVPETENGASIRTALGSMGIRFTSTIGKEMVDWAVAKAGSADKVSYGTLIVPADYLAQTNGAFTHAALLAADLDFADIVASDGLISDGNGGYEIRAALVNIQEANKGRDFVAVAYVNINGTYVYANDESANRSIDYVAKMALADTSVNSTGSYTNAVTSYYVKGDVGADGKYALTYQENAATAYSKYSDAQLAVIRLCVVE